MAGERNPIGIATELRNVVARPADSLGSILYEGGEADVGHLAIVRDHDGVAAAGKGPPDKRVGVAIALHPASPVKEHDHRALLGGLLGRPPYVERLAMLAERDGGPRTLRARAPSGKAIDDRQKLGRRCEGDNAGEHQQERDCDKGSHPLFHAVARATSYFALVLLAMSSSVTPGASSISRKALS